MATEVLMPQMGESIAEGTITRWLIAVGEKIERDQPLLEISTDKVDAEIPSPATGVLLEIRAEPDQVVPVNEVIGLIGEAGEKTEKEAGDELEVELEAEAEPSATPDEEASEEPEVDDSASSELGLEDRIRRYSSPLVRSIAKKEGVRIEDIAGSGIHGRVTKKDILAHLEGRGAEAPPTTVAGTPRAASREAGTFAVAAFHKGENVTVEPMSRIRQLTAAHMTYSKATSAHVTSVFHVDMSKVASIRARVKDAFVRENSTKLTFMPFIFKAISRTLRQFPQLNAAIDGNDIVYKNDINLGMAVAIDKGLIVPVIRRADELNLVGLARAANDLAERARAGKLQPGETGGGTFTVTNPGVFGSLFGTPVINQPQVGILGVGTIEKRAIVTTDADGHDSLAIRMMCYFALTFDHRLVDGADADRFMATVKSTIQDEKWSELDLYA